MRTAKVKDSIPPARRAYHVNDFCQRYGVGRSGVYKLLKEGKLPSVVVAGRRLIPHDAAEALLRGTAK
jgi:excisionase family DNA binding protein